jgi:hypothetical protein
MFKDIFCHLSGLLIDTGLFNPDYVFEYVELVKTTTDTKNNLFSIEPKYYKGKNAGWINVHNWDVNGTCYFRKTDKTTILRGRREKWQACSDGKMIEMRLPIRLVACVPKLKLEDSPFIDEQLAQDLIGVLQGDYNSLAYQISAQKIELNVTSTETSPMKVWESEVTGKPYSETTSQRFSYISIDFVLIIKGDSNCLQTCLTNGY